MPPETGLPPVPKHALFQLPGVQKAPLEGPCKAPSGELTDLATSPDEQGVPIRRPSPAQDQKRSVEKGDRFGTRSTEVSPAGSDRFPAAALALDSYLHSQGLQGALQLTPPREDQPAQENDLASPANAETEEGTLALAMAREQIRALEWRLACTQAELEQARRREAVPGSRRAEARPAGALLGAETLLLTGGDADSRPMRSSSAEEAKRRSSPGAALPQRSSSSAFEPELTAFARKTAALKAQVLARGGGGSSAGDTESMRPVLSGPMTTLSSRLGRQSGQGGGVTLGKALSGPQTLSGKSNGPMQETPASREKPAAAWEPGSKTSSAASRRRPVISAQLLSPIGPESAGSSSKSQTARSWPTARLDTPAFRGAGLATTPELEKRVARSVHDMLLVGVGDQEAALRHLSSSRLGRHRTADPLIS